MTTQEVTDLTAASNRVTSLSLSLVNAKRLKIQVIDAYGALAINLVSSQTVSDLGSNYSSVFAEVFQEVSAYPANGAITLASGVVKLSKTSAGAYTLAAPTTAQDDMYLIIFTSTAFAHVITATGLLDDGTATPKNTATFAATVGSSLTLQASSGKWKMLNKNNCTIAS